jgi:hypothetical protein
MDPLLHGLGLLPLKLLNSDVQRTDGSPRAWTTALTRY